MSTYTETRTLDLLKRKGRSGGIPPITLRRGESGMTVKGVITYDDATFSLTGYTAKFCAINASGGIVRKNATVTNAASGEVEYAVGTDLTANSGPVLVAYFELTKEGQTATSDTLPFIVLPNADLDGPEAEEYQSLVDELIATLQDAITDAGTATDAANTAAAAANSAADRAESFLAPHFDQETGRYDNLDRWMALKDDGQVYGVRIPKYDYSPVTTAVKTGANSWKVLEASTEDTSGRNDYAGIALFACPRVHGGSDADGMPYVTSIEGRDGRFDAEANDTYALTPVYYRRITDEGNYILKEYSFAPRTGFTACRGAFAPDGTLRPFILRSCYMDSDGQFSSKSGEQPVAYQGSPTIVVHCSNNDFSWSKARTSTDGLTYYDYGDLQWMMDFMELMLGVKAPRDAAVGCTSYNYQYQVAAAETGVKRVILTDAQAANIEVGSSMSVGTRSAGNSDRNQATMHDVAASAKVLSKVPLGDGKTAVYLDLDATIDVAATYYASTMPWRNGSCDGVLGTFGAPTAAGLTNGKFPFKFQNCEFLPGLHTVVMNMHSVNSVSGDVQKHAWWIATDVSNCPSNNEGTGWTKLDGETVAATQNAWNYIKDYGSEKGAPFPASVGGTSSTGHRTAWHPGSTTAQSRELLVGGSLDNGAYAGVGCARSNSALSSASWSIGGRSSTIGHSALAE